jgi:hypothetical protein
MINGQMVPHDAVIVRPCDLGKMIMCGEYFQDEELPDIIKAATDKIIGRLPIPSTKPEFM